MVENIIREMYQRRCQNSEFYREIQTENGQQNRP